MFLEPKVVDMQLINVVSQAIHNVAPKKMHYRQTKTHIIYVINKYNNSQFTYVFVCLKLYKNSLIKCQILFVIILAVVKR